MKSAYRLKKNYQYNYVYKHATTVSDRHLVVLYCKSNNKGNSRIGFSVSKKHGKAVVRNRLRRQLKAAMSQMVTRLAVGYNIIVVPRQQQPYQFATIIDSLNTLLSQAGLLVE